jgi:hypothetical protein
MNFESHIVFDVFVSGRSISVYNEKLGVYGFVELEDNE